MTSLNPVFTVGRQIGEVLRHHLGLDRAAARDRTLELLELVGIPAPARRIDEYPHQLSGGMRQRVMIAMAVACNPKVLIADEPTTALDVTIQAGILDLMRDIRERLGTAILLITHDLGVVADVADRVIVMYAGRLVEEAAADELFAHPQHPYTTGLLAALPRSGRRSIDEPLQEIPGVVPSLAQLPDACAFAPRCPRADDGSASRCRRSSPSRPEHPRRLLPPRGGGMERTLNGPVLEVDGLVKHFGEVQARRRRVADARARRGARAGGRVGQRQVDGRPTASCGCSTRPRARSASRARTSRTLSRKQLRPLRRELHMVFQDPYSSLNPRMTVGDIAGEPLRLHGLASGAELDTRVAELFEQVGLRGDLRDRYPHELSGGQRQRVGLARALSVKPSVLIADEPVSALDVSVQAGILNLLRELQAEMGFSCLFITHDLSIVEYLCDRVAVMYLGEVVETGTREALFDVAAAPLHAGAAVGRARARPGACSARAARIVLEGDIPSPADPPSGCRFRTRCPLSDESSPRCVEERPALRGRRPSGGVSSRRRRAARELHHPPGAARHVRDGRLDALARLGRRHVGARARRQRVRRGGRGRARAAGRRAAPQRAGRRHAGDRLLRRARRRRRGLRPGAGAGGGDARALRRARPRPDPGHGPAGRGRAGRVRRLDADAARLRHLGARRRDGARDRLRGRRLPARARHPRRRSRASRTCCARSGRARRRSICPLPRCRRAVPQPGAGRDLRADRAEARRGGHARGAHRRRARRVLPRLGRRGDRRLDARGRGDGLERRAPPRAADRRRPRGLAGDARGAGDARLPRPHDLQDRAVGPGAGDAPAARAARGLRPRGDGSRAPTSSTPSSSARSSPSPTARRGTATRSSPTSRWRRC